MLRDLFGNPALAADKRRVRGRAARLPALGDDRAACRCPAPHYAAYPDTVDAVFRKMLRRRDFTWAEHRRGADAPPAKAWYYRREPRPGVTVIGDRLLELPPSAVVS